MKKIRNSRGYWTISRRAIEADKERVFPSRLSDRSWFGSLFPMLARQHE